MTLEQIREAIKDNRLKGREQFFGLSSSDIGRYNRALMFGEDGEAFPDQETWSRIVD